ncbi:Tex family protein [Alloiococcus otitis]|uniref:Tex family protein n=1 Tax=Alloiococcus otitis TaxID=1652 RepID=UPI0023523A75|nr:Tex family protein [Alloiococcus otitis]
MNIEESIKANLLKDLSDFTTKQVTSVLDLLEEGNTVPFIARYRKDQTGALDEVQIRTIQDRYHYLKNLQDRKGIVMESIASQGKLSQDLKAAILQANQLQEVEDLYRPYKKKRRTKASQAKEAGLQALADWLLTFSDQDIETKAQDFIDPDKGVDSSQAGLDGAFEIIAEAVGDKPEYRKRLRDFMRYNALYTSKVKDENDDPKGIYQNYYDYSESYRTIAHHRVLALNRGEEAGVLSVSLDCDPSRVQNYVYKQEIPAQVNNPASQLVKKAIDAAFKRFIQPAIERELRSDMTQAAEDQAIQVFGDNLRNLLLQPPLKDQVVLGLDPAFRTGCKLAVVDKTGKVLAIKVIYPHNSKKKYQEAKFQLTDLVQTYQVDTIAIGNGTASRESEQFVSEVVQDLDRFVAYVIVSEAGASVYSASDEARREFPDLQVEERSAVSIARRLQDPLAELVKIDPKSIGVGQYQHDLSQAKLTDQLDFVVETAVNQVGVNLNTASASLLEHVSGLTQATAQNIVAYREDKGQYTERQQIKSVKRLGPKTYQQAVGFLRIPNGAEPFDQTGIHPESYQEAEIILTELGFSKDQVGSQDLADQVKKADDQALLEATGLGRESYQDIIQGLVKPGRDMRDDRPAPLLRQDVLKMEDLKEGMQLEGTVRNVVDFGAFVDIGVKEDGLVHISKMSKDYTNHPRDRVSVGDIVTVWIDGVDLDKGRISLTMVDKG